MKKVLMGLFAVMLLTCTLLGQFTTDWERKTPGSDPSWMTTGSNTRGLGYGYVNGNQRLYVAYDGNKIKILNAETGSDVGDLTMTGVSGGARSLNIVKVAEDDRIFGCNLTTNATTSAFKVYMWNGESGTPTEVVSYNTEAYRLGDNFAVIGSYESGTAVIYAAAGTTNRRVLRWTQTGANSAFNSTPDNFDLPNTAADWGTPAYVAPVEAGSDSKFWAGGRSQTYLREYTSLNTSTGYVSISGVSSVKYFYYNQKEYLVCSLPGTFNAKLQEIGASGTTWTDRTGTTYGSTAALGATSAGGLGDVDVRSNGDGSFTVYVLITNNGIGAYTTDSSPLNSQLTPKTVTMSEGVSNADAFSPQGLIGSDGSASFYAHWDADYLYLGWSGGRTNYSSDLYYAAIDTDPDGTDGTNSSIIGVGFASGDPNPDYFVVYENNSTYYGAPASEGNAYELYFNQSGSWGWSSRTSGDDGTSSQVVFSDDAGEVRLRIAWNDLSFSPGNSAKVGLVMWNNNSSGDYMWARIPDSNPGNGSTPKTLSTQIVFNSTGDGVNPSNSFQDQSLPVTLSSFTAKAVKGKVVLEWETSAEIENQGFVLSREERGTRNEWDGFETRPEIIAGFAADDALKGQGTTTETTKYVFVDKTVEPGNIYVYTLADVDYKGNVNELKEVEVKVDAEDAVVADGFVLDPVYPNPFNAEFTVPFTLNKSMHVVIDLYNMKGQRIKSITNRLYSPGYYELKVNADDISSGIYFVKAASESFSYTQKIILMK